jgi:hypothetical protein
VEGGLSVCLVSERESLELTYLHVVYIVLQVITG